MTKSWRLCKAGMNDESRYFMAVCVFVRDLNPSPLIIHLHLSVRSVTNKVKIRNALEV